MRPFIIPIVLALAALVLLLRPPRHEAEETNPAQAVSVDHARKPVGPVATEPSPVEETDGPEVAEPEPAVPSPMAPDEVLYVVKRFSEPSDAGVRGFPPGKEVRFLRQEAGYYVVSDGEVEARRPRSWFTRDLKVVDEVLRAESGSVPAPAESTDSAVAEATPPVKEKFVAAGPPGGTPPRLWSAAQAIDGLVAKHHAAARRAEPALIADDKFLRRAYLVTIGRIPTAEEADTFLSSNDPDKRAVLIGRLVRTPGYASHMANWTFDRLRVVDRKAGQPLRFHAYRNWVRDAVEKNMAWDDMVAALLTAEGDGWNPGTAAVGYHTRDRGMALDNMAVTMRIFLGSRMECAQCHDDPFGDTKQKAFFRLAAFSNGTGAMKQDLMRDLFNEMNAKPQVSLEHQAAWMFWRDIYGLSLAGGGTGRIALPHDYRYRDARPGDIEGARAPFGKPTSLAGTRDRDDGRRRLAAWMTGGTGERFPAMIANQMWKRVMGAGFFEPADDYVELSETGDPALSGNLANLMTSLDYNLRDFQHALLLTRAFQYETEAEPSATGGADDFRGRRVVRLSAEQLWDSLITLLAGDPDGQPRSPLDQTIYVGGRPVLQGKMTMEQLSGDVLALETPEQVRAYFDDFVARVRAEEESGAGAEKMEPRMRQQPVDFVRGAHPRASELPSPAPADHFLALFGQSNREVVDGASREPNMGQVLALMNGFVQREVLAQPEAVLNREVAAADSPEEKIKRLYLTVLSREPSAEEMNLMLDEFEADPESAPTNIAAAMVMSAEFLYLQ